MVNSVSGTASSESSGNHTVVTGAGTIDTSTPPIRQPEGGRSWVRILSAIAVALIAVFLHQPVPVALSGGSWFDRLLTRAWFQKELLTHVLGMHEDYSVEELMAKYRDLLPQNTTIPASPTYQPLPEIDATVDGWREKLETMYTRQVDPVAVVVRNLTHVDDGFGRMKEWDLDYFQKNVYGGHDIPVFTNVTMDKSVIDEPFDEFVRGIRDPNRIRYARCISDRDGILSQEFEAEHVLELMGQSRLGYELMMGIDGGKENHCFFIGGKHVHSRMHTDVMSSAFFMIEGRKRWVLYPPSETMFMFPKAHRLNVAYNADFDVFNPDMERLPLFGLAQGYEVVLNPGDVMFFPSFWWHAVQNLDDVTIGMDFPTVDWLGSLRKDFAMAAGTMFNVKSMWNIGKAFVQGRVGRMRNSFFDYYRMDVEN